MESNFGIVTGVNQHQPVHQLQNKSRLHVCKLTFLKVYEWLE